MKVQTNWHIIRDLGHGESNPLLGAFGRGKMYSYLGWDLSTQSFSTDEGLCFS